MELVVVTCPGGCLTLDSLFMPIASRRDPDDDFCFDPGDMRRQVLHGGRVRATELLRGHFR